MVQLVRGLLLESLVRGSKPLAGGLLLESLVGSWGPTCLAIVHFGPKIPGVPYRKPSNPHGTGHPGSEPVRLVIHIFSLSILADGGETAQVTGRAVKAWPIAHVDLGLHVARLMRAAVGGVHL